MLGTPKKTKIFKNYFLIGEEVEKRFALDYVKHFSEKNGFVINHFLNLLKITGFSNENHEEFVKEFKKSITTPVSPTIDENMFNHWDVSLFDYKIDVKGLRKKKRSDEDYDEEIHWIELKNVKGNIGWLYGESDYFAFELKKSWILVCKTDLQNFIHEVCKDKIKSDKPELYKLYTRNGRKDILTIVKSLDLCQISTEIIKKY